jgi:hypothetical protein
MAQHPESYRNDFEPNQAPKKGEGIILPFKPRTGESTAEANRPRYEEYKALKGTLDETEYQNVLSRIADSKEVPLNSSTLLQANLMAETAGIVLSPETIVLYGMLRHDEKPDQETEKIHYSTRSDQELLAEALRIADDKDSLTTFIEKFPNIFKTV